MSVNASSIVYAYGDRFVEGRPRVGGAQLPCRDVKVNKRELANVAMVGAFVALADAGRIRLSVGKRRALLGLRKRDVVFVEPLADVESSASLEAGLLASASGDEALTSIGKVVERLLPMSGDPWADVIARVEEDLLERGYFTEAEREKKVAAFFLGKKLEPNCGRFAALEDQVGAVDQMLRAFGEANGTVYAQLVKDVRGAIRSRQEVDMDMD
ncbi:MAG: hypothetical protein PVH50_11200 [Anaerolineae bacterium]